MLLAGLALCSCSNKETAPNVSICMEIPFIDAREGACATTVSKSKYLVKNQEWEKMRPHMLMIHADSWSEIRKSWKKACRYAGQDCNIQVDSVDGIIRDLDKLASQFGGK